MSKYPEIIAIIDKAVEEGAQEYEEGFQMKETDGRHTGPMAERSGKNTIKDFKTIEKRIIDYIERETAIIDWNNKESRDNFCEDFNTFLKEQIKPKFLNALSRVKTEEKPLDKWIKFEKWINTIRTETLKKIEETLEKQKQLPMSISTTLKVLERLPESDLPEGLKPLLENQILALAGDNEKRAEQAAINLYEYLRAIQGYLKLQEEAKKKAERAKENAEKEWFRAEQKADEKDKEIVALRAKIKELEENSNGVKNLGKDPHDGVNGLTNGATEREKKIPEEKPKGTRNSGKRKVEQPQREPNGAKL